MARIPLAIRIGILSGLVWLASGVLFAGIVWFSLLDSDAIRLVVPATIPVDLWHGPPALAALVVAGSGVAMAASATFVAARVLAATPQTPRPIVFVAMWFGIIVIAACIGALDGVAQVIGNWPPPRLAFVVQGIPDAIAPTLYAGLVLGWIPALVLARSRRPETVAPSRGLAPVLIAVAAALVLLIASSVAIGTARAAGLAGELPPPCSNLSPRPDRRHRHHRPACRPQGRSIDPGARRSSCRSPTTAATGPPAIARTRSARRTRARHPVFSMVTRTSRSPTPGEPRSPQR